MPTVSITVPAALAAMPPPSTAPAYVHDAWDRLQKRINDRNDVSSHASEGESYSRDLEIAERLLLQDWEAYNLLLEQATTLPGTNEILLRQPSGRGFDFSSINFHQL